MPDEDAIREYCRRDAELTLEIDRAFSGFCFWASPQWIADNPGRVWVDDSGYQHFLK
jgi:hypothetical protein